MNKNSREQERRLESDALVQMSFKIMDTHGRLVCTAEAQTALEEEGQRLHGLKIVSPDNKHSVDLFELCGITDLEEERVFLTDGDPEYKYESAAAYVQSPISLKSLGDFFHEIGHMMQRQDPHYSRLRHLSSLIDYESRGVITFEVWFRIVGWFEEILQQSAEEECFIGDVLDYFKDLHLSFPEEDFLEIERCASEQAEAQFNTAIARHARTLRLLLREPQRIRERDATKRALAWSADICDRFGIDLSDGGRVYCDHLDALRTYEITDGTRAQLLPVIQPHDSG